MAAPVQQPGLHLAPGMYEAIIAHAMAGFPYEVCGILAGKQGQAVELYPGRNISSAPHVTYELDPETLALQIVFDSEGLELIGIYHSHPTGPETPSATDIELAFYPDAIYLICSLADRSRPTLRGFRIFNGRASEVQLLAP